MHLRTLGALRLTRGGLDDAAELLRRKKRMALLVYLAVEHAGHFCARDVLLAVFWPDTTERRARNALRQALHVLRVHLGHGILVTRGNGVLMLDPRHVHCDAVDFIRALHQEDWRRAVDLYGGDFLDGFHVDGVWPFAEWADNTRTRLRREAAWCFTRNALASLARGETQAAMDDLRTARRLTPWNEVIVRTLIRAHLEAGDRAGAAAVLRAFTTDLRDALDTEPLPETVDALRRPAPSGGTPRVRLTGASGPRLRAFARPRRDAHALDSLHEYLAAGLDAPG